MLKRFIVGVMLAAAVIAAPEGTPPKPLAAQDAPKADNLPPAKMPKGNGKPKHRGLVIPKDVKKRHADSWARHGHHLKAMPKVQATSFDCRKVVMADGSVQNWVPDFDDQGQCGDCWVFSGADTCASAFIKAGFGKLTISKQQLLDCQFQDACNGGWPEDVAKVAKTSGVVTDKDYGVPYNASPGQCKSIDPSKILKIADYGFVSQSDGVADYQAFKACMVKFGVISICYDATGTPDTGEGGPVWKGTGGNNIDHAIKAIAFDDSKAPNGAVLCWNQWHADLPDLFWAEWGANGIGTSALWTTATALPPPPVPPGPTPPGPTPPGPTPPGPTPGPGFTGTVTYSYASGTLTGITTGTGDIAADLKAAGVVGSVADDVLKLVTDLKAKAGLATILADLAKIAEDSFLSATPEQRRTCPDRLKMPNLP